MGRLLLFVLSLAALSAFAQDAAGPAFNIEVRAPRELRQMLERNLELRRYREVADLDDTELARLISSAERNARELVATQGYFDPKITVRREEAAGGKRVIVVEVEPGRLTHAAQTKIDFEGAIADSRETDDLAQRNEIETGWRLPRGHAFTQEDWDDAKTHALRLMIQRRYPAGRISYSLADVDAATASASLWLRIDSGPLFRLGAMQVTGMRRYDPVLVTGSGYFDTAFIYVDPQGDPKAAPVEVTVREAPLHRVVVGPGVSTDSGARLSLEYRNNSVPGIGWQAVTKLQLERKAPFIEAELKAIPRESGWRWDLLARAERTDDGTLVTHAQRYRGGQTWAGGHIERNVYVQYDRATVQASPGVPTTSIPDNGDGEALSVNYVWTGRYFDRMPYPTRGYGVSIEVGGGVTLTGSKSDQMDTLKSLAALTGTLHVRTQMFRTGGDTTVRGYGYREIGVDRNGIVAPGRYEAVGSVEWQKPIRRNGVETNFESVVFVDSGAVADRVQNLRPVYGAGVGARYKSPLGPIEGAVAYGFKPKKIRLHFTIGLTF